MAQADSESILEIFATNFVFFPFYFLFSLSPFLHASLDFLLGQKYPFGVSGT
jgi:hypothetical protein